jgi:hypothetical protein
MRTSRLLYVLGTVAVGFGLYWAASRTELNAQQETVKIKPTDIGGVVTSAKGPEAGAWVIAETTDLPTKYAKIVVTDDRGRYVVPDLPKANYNVWSRGYGLVDSPKVQAAPGKNLNLTAVVAPSAKAAADYYPASYWYSLLKVPEKSKFPGTGPQGNGFSPKMKSQAELIELLKTDSCWSCHQLGTKATRTIPALFSNLDSPVKQWERRIQSGQAGAQMLASVTNMGKEGALAMFADWTNRIAAGELPPQPPRPQGVERNVVITEWDWASPKAYLHDEIATDKRNPSLNANGLLYGSPELSTDNIPILDPVHNTATSIKMPVRDPKTPAPGKPLQASAYWGDEPIWDSQANMHNPMFDEKGRVWFTSVVRPPENPAFCKEGSSHPSAKLFPVERSGRQLAFFDPKSKQFTLIDTCFSTHHLQFAKDANNTLWTSSGGGGNVIGWLNVKKFEETHDEQASQGWTGLILDTNGNGKRDAFVGPNDPLDPTKDKQISGSPYGVTISPADGTIWGSILGFPGKIVRVVPGSNPTETALTEVYELPWNNPKAKVQGFSPRGLDIDTNGVVWTVLSSGHFASFDRRKCTGKLNGPNATGQQCPEGWTLYPFPVPNLKGVTDSGSAEASYYDWVDQFDTLGLGKNTPIATGNGEDGLLAVVNGKWVTMRVPYPIGYFAKGLDGRIDDPKAGWKGKGLWSTYSTRTMFHTETGKGTMSKVLHFQLRPDPLAD